MMVSMSQVIATRTLRAGDHEVLVTVYAPVESSQVEDEWGCSWRIEGLPDERVVQMTNFGIDAVQALILALAMIGDHLEGERERCDLTFLDHPELGFPVTRLPRNGRSVDLSIRLPLLNDKDLASA